MTSESKSNNLRKKSSIRLDGSYRVFHITRKHDESDDEENLSSKITKDHEIKGKYQKKSFKISNRNGLDGLKRKSTKRKRLLFLHKASCESTTNEPKTPPLPNQLTNDRSSSILSNEISTNQKKQSNFNESSESDVLLEAINETIQDNDNTLDDLLARADQLETTVKKQEFNKIQPLSRANLQQRRKHFLIACTTILIIFTIVITIAIFVVVMTLRYKKHTSYSMRSPSVYDG